MSLAQILLERKLVTAEQLEEALYCRQEHGGLVEDHLYRLGYVDRSSLLKVMESYYGCPSVDLARISPSPEALALVPANVAWAQQVAPFDYDAINRVLKVACRNPLDDSLRSALAGLTSTVTIQLHSAIGAAIQSALAACYRPVTDDEHPWDSGSSTITPEKSTGELDRRAVLLVAPKGPADQCMAEALAGEGATVVSVDCVAEAIDELQNTAFSAVLIHDTNESPYSDLVNCLRTTNPGCSVRFYESPASLLLDGTEDTDELAHMMTSNLHLFASVLASKRGKTVTSEVRIGPLVDRLCLRLGLNTRDRMVIVSAAYLQDLAQLYFDGSVMMDNEQRLFMLLSAAGESLIFSPSIVAVTRAMGQGLQGLKDTESIPFEVLGGNIVAVVCFYCRLFPFDTRLTGHQFDIVTENLRGRVGKDFLPEVVELFLNVLQEEVVGPADQRLKSQILLLNNFGSDGESLESGFVRLGFACTSVDSVDETVFRYEQIKPDILVVAIGDKSGEVTAPIEELSRRGISVHDLPTFMLVRNAEPTIRSQLLRMGVEDVINYDGSLDVLLVKIQRLQTSQEKESRRRLSVLQDMGTHGSLTHMNVIDLLQAMGHGEKTVRISVTAEGEQLTMYLGQGKLLYAECGEHTGAEAVFQALAWSRGIWSVDQVGDEELPNINIHRSIDSILIEGVHRVDERARAAATPPPAEVFN